MDKESNTQGNDMWSEMGKHFKRSDFGHAGLVTNNMAAILVTVDNAFPSMLMHQQ